ncbi:cobalamin-independent methionine synthase II family protein [Rickettsiaceae bacterium]|nr:cobalamin-independent methionine synthase II family protein [Rickettsiaceae bacterium]
MSNKAYTSSVVFSSFLPILLIVTLSFIDLSKASEEKTNPKNLLLTTTVGAYPKPSYIVMPDWFDNTNDLTPSVAYEKFIESTNENKLHEDLDRAIKDVIEKQIAYGIDIPTDGEIKRENYIYYFCRKLGGINFSVLAKKTARKNWHGFFPTITGKITHPKTPIMVNDYQYAQNVSTHPIKVTIPGPMTIIDSLANNFYDNDRELGEDIAKAINAEIRALAASGCKWIQIDDPVLARKPEKALDYGIDLLEKCFEDIPKDVISIVHLCCGYPSCIDEEDFPKAEQDSYLKIVKKLDNSKIKAFSIEDTHRRNSSELFREFKNSIVILGVIDIGKSRIETVDEIKDHINYVLQYIPAERLMIAPDCGLGLLSNEMVDAKLRNMNEAVLEIRNG